MRKPPEFLLLQHLRQAIASIKRNHTITLEHYLSNDRLGFYHQPNARAEAACSSSATCITSLVHARRWGAGRWSNLTSGIAKRLIKKPWESAGLERDNPFTVSFIVEGILDLQEVEPGYAGARVHKRTISQKAAPLLLDRLRQGHVSISPYPPSAYLTQLAYRVLKRTIPIPRRLNRDIHDWAQGEINRQISLISLQEKTADPLNLAYAIILLRETAIQDLTSTEEQRIYEHALDIFFVSQNKGDGSWPQSQPLFHYPKVGNAYCFEYELLAQMLASAPVKFDLIPYLPEIALAVERLERSGLELGASLQGRIVAWPSGHHPQIGGPESWSTACVYDFAFNLDRVVAEAIRQGLFRELGIPYSAPTKSEARKFAPDLLDADLHEPNSSRSLSLLRTLEDRFVKRVANESAVIAAGASLSKTTPISAILFGPPGTSKTQLASRISRYLGWPLLTVDPSHLVQDGVDKVLARANRLFGMLAVSEQIVVLLDEFDEMGRARSHHQELISRFITTAMLPKLAQINDERKIVFLLATNYISGFDSAFIRPGRFDMRIQVMPPNFKAKCRAWSKLEDVLSSLQQEERTEARSAIEDLTFDEFMRTTKELDTQDKPVERLRIIRNSKARGTLAQPNEISEVDRDPQNAEDSSARADCSPHTWKTTCQYERRWISLPPRNF